MFIFWCCFSLSCNFYRITHLQDFVNIFFCFFKLFFQLVLLSCDSFDRIPLFYFIVNTYFKKNVIFFSIKGKRKKPYFSLRDCKRISVSTNWFAASLPQATRRGNRWPDVPKNASVINTLEAYSVPNTFFIGKREHTAPAAKQPIIVAIS